MSFSIINCSSWTLSLGLTCCHILFTLIEAFTLLLAIHHTLLLYAPCPTLAAIAILCTHDKRSSNHSILPTPMLHTAAKRDLMEMREFVHAPTHPIRWKFVKQQWHLIVFKPPVSACDSDTGYRIPLSTFVWAHKKKCLAFILDLPLRLQWQPDAVASSCLNAPFGLKKPHDHWKKLSQFLASLEKSHQLLLA